MAAEPVAFVELHVSCKDLLNKDYLSKSDPLVTVSIQANGQWFEQGRTEWIKDSLSPRFLTAIRVPYHFESVQNVRLRVYDIDNLHASLEGQDFLGEVYTTLAEIITVRGGVWSAQLKSGADNRSRGMIEVVSEEVRDLNQELRIVFEGHGLDKKDLFGSSDPFLVVNVTHGDKVIPVVQTEVIKNNVNPKWNPLVVSVQKVCNGDYDRPLVITVFDWNKSGSHEVIGTAHTTLRDLTARRTSMELAHPKKKKCAGTVSIVSCDVRQIPTFTEYLRGGMEVSLITAIDFTASNGDPRTPSSLHFFNPSAPNNYAQAINSVGEILAYYDRDKMFPVYGFGASLPPNNQVSHCFALNGNPSNPEVLGVPGIIDAYQKALATVKLYGPTLFTPVLEAASYICEASVARPGLKYFILLIITDGAINDMDNTIATIVRAANSLPLSIVVVGVGSADFTNMRALDADDGPLKAPDGTKARRDIVQFVPYETLKNGPYQRLAQETLAEIPGQVLSYMAMKGIPPPPPAPVAPVVPVAPIAPAAPVQMP